MPDTTPTTDPPLPSAAGTPADVAPQADAPPDEPAPDGAALPSVAPRRTGWREESLGTALSTAAVGIWLIVSPEALGYGPGDATWNPVVGGVLITVFSIARVIGSWRTLALGVVLLVVGAWLAGSAFIFEAPIGGQWNQALFGGIVVLLSLIGLAGAQRGRELDQG